LRNFLRRGVFLVILLFGALGNVLVAHRRRRITPVQPRILLVHPGHMGAIVLMTPILHALREQAPQAHITVLVGPWSQEVVARHPDVDQVMTCTFPSHRDNSLKAVTSYRALLKTARQLRKERYDLAINLRPHFWWGAALLYLAHVPYRVGCAVEPSKLFLDTDIPPVPRQHHTAAYLQLASAGLRALGLAGLPPPYTADRYPLFFQADEAEEQWAVSRLQAEGIDLTTSLIIIHPGSGGAVKLWRPEAWATCADILAQPSAMYPKRQVLLTGSKGELPLLQKIAHIAQSQTTILTNLTLGQLAALLQRATLVLGVDSGPLHLAVAQKTATVRLYGPMDARIFGPWGSANRHAVVTAKHRCPSCPVIPCNRLAFQEYELEAHPCVRLISEQEVLATITAMFAYLLPAASEQIGAETG
jgi:ADP-heptose:LPS heptosyltransferase